MAETFFLGVTREHCDQTTLAHALRELATNAVDADPHLGMDKVIAVTRRHGGGEQAVIVNRSTRPLLTDHLLQGPSIKKGSDAFFGGFGCGLKDSMAVFVREGVGMTITTRTWRGVVAEKVRASEHTALQVTRPEVCVELTEANAADIAKLDAHLQGAAVCIELQDATSRLQLAVKECRFTDLAKFTLQPPQLKLPKGRGAWRISPTQGAGGNGHARLTLRGLYWADIPIRGCADLVLELTKLSAEERNAIGRDRRNLKLNTVIEAVCQALKLLVVHVGTLPAHLQTALAAAAGMQGMHSEIAKVLRPLAPDAVAQPPQQQQQPSWAKKGKGQQQAKGGRGTGGGAFFQPPAQSCQACSSKNIEIRELRRELAELKAQLGDARAQPRSTGQFMLPPNTTDGLTTWAKRSLLTQGAQDSMAMLLVSLTKTLESFGYRDPVVTGSTARGTAVRGSEVDIDIAVWIPDDVSPPTKMLFEGSALDTRSAFVFKPRGTTNLLVMCGVAHPSYLQHPIDIQFFTTQEAHTAKVSYLRDRLTAPAAGEAGLLLVIALKRWARNVRAMHPAATNKVNGFILELIAADAMSKHAGGSQLSPELFAYALRLVSAPPVVVREMFDVTDPAYALLATSAIQTIPNYTK